MSISNFESLQKTFSGEIFTDNLMRSIYATDASVYRELPLAVAYPKTKEDIKLLIKFAQENNTSLIPRTAGTSLAGQCVGNGIVVDVSKHFTQIIEVNQAENWVKVQPGVVRDELNHFFKGKNLFFGPETSTANRAMIGGMVGNNSCGSNSIVYGTTRDHLLEVEAILSDGSEVLFKDITIDEFQAKCAQTDLEGTLYRQIKEDLSQAEIQQNIKEHFPKETIHRRNTGYAVDELLKSEVFTKEGSVFNFSKLIAGSEGTLALITAVKLHCNALPPKHSVLICPHFHSVNEALQAVLVAMSHQPFSCELMDKVIMDCTKENLEYSQYRFFLEGEPEAVLMIELKHENEEELEQLVQEVVADLKIKTKAYAFPKIYPPETNLVWNLRKAGLGLLANIPGDEKAVAVIEDTAVDLQDLPQYIEEFSAMMAKFGQKAVYYAHAGAGELHLRPILNLKAQKDVALFKEIALETAKLVKKYKGSLSGEHGDGRVRAPFLPMMIGEENYQLLKKIKHTWDPKNIFNPGKIIDAAPIEQYLRYEPDRKEPEFSTLLDFNKEGNILKLAEKCNGSGDCRKTELSGGTMCPSYMATRNEKDTTRARANTLREFLTQNNDERKKWNSPEIKEALDLCLSCKGCKNECPSNVDMALMKAEFTYQYNQINGTPFRSKLFGNVAKLNRLGSIFPAMTNAINSLSITKKIMGVAKERTPPKIAKQTLKSWFSSRQKTDYSQTTERSRSSGYSSPTPSGRGLGGGALYFFADEFTNYNDVEIGKKAILLLEKLGYEVHIAPIADSGRAYISKGMLKEAKVLATQNLNKLLPVINAKMPLIGLEPSAILSFRDEYQRMDERVKEMAPFVFTIEEFLALEIEKGNISSDLFDEKHQQIKLHGHCHQKALSKVSYTQKILSLPKNYHVEVLPTGCCGMAGSFGYEKEHYEVSMQIGELVLFPAVRKATENEIICAPGTSCRHQIFDGTTKNALHPVEILWKALK